MRRLVVDGNEVKARLLRIEAKQFEDADYEFIKAVIESYQYIAELSAQPGMTMDRLHELCFGSHAEASEG
jgi:hypothetical protein